MKMKINQGNTASLPNCQKREVKFFRYDIKGKYIAHEFMMLDMASNLAEMLNKKPYKELKDGVVEYNYITDDLNTEKSYASKKWLLEPHRLYFFVLNPATNSVELEFTKNMEGFIDTMLISRKLSKYRCFHQYTLEDNYMFKFGGLGDSIYDKTYFISDEDDLDAAKEVFHDKIYTHIKEIETELDFYKNMLEGVNRADIKVKTMTPEEVIESVDSREPTVLDGIEVETIIVEKKGIFSSFFRKLSFSK